MNSPRCRIDPGDLERRLRVGEIDANGSATRSIREVDTAGIRQAVAAGSQIASRFETCDIELSRPVPGMSQRDTNGLPPRIEGLGQHRAVVRVHEDRIESAEE